jgi:hypothetical protein
LVGEDVGDDATSDHFWQHVRTVSQQAHRSGCARVLDDLEGLVERVGDRVAIAGREPLFDPGEIDVDADEVSACHRCGQWLGAAHATHTAADGELALQRSAKVLARAGHERLKGALHDALAADVDPRSRRHLAVHHQPSPFELVEVLPIGPSPD